jgi:hypothetical protein
VGCNYSSQFRGLALRLSRSACLRTLGTSVRRTHTSTFISP